MSKNILLLFLVIVYTSVIGQTKHNKKKQIDFTVAD